MKLYSLKIREARELLDKKEISCLELVDSVLERVEDVEDIVKGYVTVTGDYAREKARQLDQAADRGESRGPLAGIPFALKDNICTRGILTTCSSKMLHNFRPPYNATVFDLLEQAGGVLVGKTNLDEFAMGSSTENSGFFPTRNPWDPERVPGGSSGGSAAVVAAEEAFFSLGSDTGGSIRQPASYCGVVGFKPTYGRISRYGLIAFASSLDQLGPLTRNVEDCALVMNVIGGHDARDSTSAQREVPDYTIFLGEDLGGIRLGIPEEYFTLGIHEEVRKVVAGAILELVDIGAEKVELSLPYTAYALAAYYLVNPAEASSNLARYDGIRYGLRQGGANDLLETYEKTRSAGFGPEVKRRIMLGTYALSSGYYEAYYLKAQKVRTLIKRDFEQGFQYCDVMVTPTAPSVAFKAGEKIKDPLTMYLNDVFTIPVSMAGLPAVSIPCGYVEGLPVGLQVIGRPFQEGVVLKVARAFEKKLSLQGHRPGLSGKIQGGV